MNKEDKYLLNYSEDINIKSLEEKTENIELTQTVVTNNCGVTGVVTDEEGTAIENATVKVFDLNFNPVKHTMTNKDGIYSIVDLAPGEYIVYAVKDGYSLSTKRQVTLTDSIKTLANIVIDEKELYKRGTLYGIVYNNNNEPLSNVKITLSTLDNPKEVIAKTYSTTDGEYVFYDLDEGTFEVNAINDDYVLTTPFNVLILDNTNTKEKLYLDKLSNAKEGTINGIITDKVTSIPIENAFVGLYVIDETEEEVLETITTTDREGKYFFGYVPEGSYIIKAKAVK